MISSKDKSAKSTSLDDPRQFGSQQPTQSINTVSSQSTAAAPQAVIGPKISFKGELVGEEDLLIQGNVEGTIDLKNHNLTVGDQGIIKANAHAKTIVIEGRVEGDLFGEERIVIKESSNVSGNLTAERVALEDGAKFRGSIDMDVKPSKSAVSNSSMSSASSSQDKTADKAPA